MGRVGDGGWGGEARGWRVGGEGRREGRGGGWGAAGVGMGRGGEGMEGGVERRGDGGRARRPALENGPALMGRRVGRPGVGVDSSRRPAPGEVGAGRGRGARMVESLVGAVPRAGAYWGEMGWKAEQEGRDPAILRILGRTGVFWSQEVGAAVLL